MGLEVDCSPVSLIFSANNQIKEAEINNWKGGCMLTPIQADTWRRFYEQQGREFEAMQIENHNLEREIKNLKTEIDHMSRDMKERDKVNSQLQVSLGKQNSELIRLKQHMETLIDRNDCIRNENRFLDSQIKIRNQEWEKKYNQLSIEKEQVKVYWASQMQRAIYESELKIQELTTEIERCHQMAVIKFHLGDPSKNLGSEINKGSEECNILGDQDYMKELNQSPRKTLLGDKSNYGCADQSFKESIKVILETTLDPSLLDQFDSMEPTKEPRKLADSTSVNPGVFSSNSVNEAYLGEEFNPTNWEANLMAVKKNARAFNRDPNENHSLSLKEDLMEWNSAKLNTKLKGHCEEATQSGSDSPHLLLHLDNALLIDNNEDHEIPQYVDELASQSLLNPLFNCRLSEIERPNCAFNWIHYLREKFSCLKRRKSFY